MHHPPFSWDRRLSNLSLSSVDPSLQDQGGARLPLPRGERPSRALCAVPACLSTCACVMCVQMSLIFSAGSLADARPPCVLQSFINHGAVLHKVFVVGDRHFCVERPSLKNFPSGPCGQCALTWFGLLARACVRSCVRPSQSNSLRLQTERPFSSTAKRCPSRSPAVISPR